MIHPSKYFIFSSPLILHNNFLNSIEKDTLSDFKIQHIQCFFPYGSHCHVNETSLKTVFIFPFLPYRRYLGRVPCHLRPSSLTVFFKWNSALGMLHCNRGDYIDICQRHYLTKAIYFFNKQKNCTRSRDCKIFFKVCCNEY